MNSIGFQRTQLSINVAYLPLQNSNLVFVDQTAIFFVGFTKLKSSLDVVIFEIPIVRAAHSAMPHDVKHAKDEASLGN